MIFVLLFLALFAAPIHADQIDTLIDQEKKANEEWTLDADTPPPALMWGDKSTVEIYSPAAHDGKGNLLCQPIEFDELIELDRGNMGDQETILNLALPRVRELLQQSCLIRPKDSVLAVGEGWQKRVQLVDFIVRKEKPVCPQDSPYSLWASFSEPLEEDPLFFTTNEAWPEGDNGFFKLHELKPFDLQGQVQKVLSPIVPDLKEFDVTLVGIHAPNADTIFILRRRTIDLEDDSLPSEMMLYKIGDHTEKLWTERVDVKKGSGHIRIESTLDYNHDGNFDLVVSGDHMGCPYKIIFEGKKEGFGPAELPIKPCACW